MEVGTIPMPDSYPQIPLLQLPRNAVLSCLLSGKRAILAPPCIPKQPFQTIQVEREFSLLA